MKTVTPKRLSAIAAAAICAAVFASCRSDVPDSGEKLDIERALDQLDEPKRRIVTLHINAGLKFREIAEIMDIPLGTAIWRYNDAIKRLRELLS